jgi:hypothetical protein
MKHRPWHKVWQDRLLSDPDYTALSLESRGLLADLRCLAARVADGGRTGVNRSQLSRRYALNGRQIAGVTDPLSHAQYIAIRRGGDMYVLRWLESQESPSTQRVRNFRARYSNANVTRDVTQTKRVEAEADAEADIKDIPIVNMTSGRKHASLTNGEREIHQVDENGKAKKAELKFIIQQAPLSWQPALLRRAKALGRYEPERILATVRDVVSARHRPEGVDGAMLCIMGRLKDPGKTPSDAGHTWAKKKLQEFYG